MESFYERWLKRNKVENERGLQLLQTQTSLNQSEVKTIVWEKFSQNFYKMLVTSNIFTVFNILS